MFRTFFWYFIIALLVILSIPCFVIALILQGETRLKWINACDFFFVPLAMKLAGFKVEVEGKENIPDGAALFVGNHQGLFDMMIALTQFNGIKPFLAKIEASKISMIGQWMKMFGCVFIDRGNVRTSLESIKKCEETLTNGTSLIIFPEGTRSRKHEMGEFKSGAFRCALKSETPIVPFVIDGTYKAWEEHKRITPVTATLKILPPIETKGMEKERTKHISEEIYEEIKNALG